MSTNITKSSTDAKIASAVLAFLTACFLASSLVSFSARAQTYKAHPSYTNASNNSGVFKQNPQAATPNVVQPATSHGGAMAGQGSTTGAVPTTPSAAASRGQSGLRAQLTEGDTRWGVGYSYPFVSATRLPSITLRLWQNQRFGLLGAFGLDTFEHHSQLSVMGKIYYILLRESTMHFFANAAVGWLRGVRKTQSPRRPADNSNEEGANTSPAATKTSSHTFELGLNLGVEYFLFGDLKGLESALAVQFETGLSVISSSQALRFKTVALTPFQAGFTFYF